MAIIRSRSTLYARNLLSLVFILLLLYVFQCVELDPEEEQHVPPPPPAPGTSAADKSKWDKSLLYGEPIIAPDVGIEEMVQRKIIESLEWGAFFGCDKPGHSKNKWNNFEINRTEIVKNPSFLPGTTFWVNEHMSVGHLMYDIALIQILHSTRIDRIILQRAPCINYDLCAGIGTFESFFRGYFTAALEASNHTGIPIHVRWTWQQKNADPIYVTSETPSGDLHVPPERRAKAVHLTPVMYPERVIRNLMRCRYCFYPGVSAFAARRFKEAAYRMVHLQHQFHPLQQQQQEQEQQQVEGGSRTSQASELKHHFVEGDPMVVTLAYRGPPASRRLGNLQFLIDELSKHLTFPTYEFRIVNTTNNRRGYVEQINIVAQSQVVIAEHGAFQSNLIYMRNGSLLVDLYGGYGNGEIGHFRNLARMFGVYTTGVQTMELGGHRSTEYNISMSECAKVVAAVKEYREAAPYEFNMKPP